MDDHSKREGLEIFNLHEKYVFVLCFLSNPSPIRQIFAGVKKNDDVTCHVIDGKAYYT